MKNYLIEEIVAILAVICIITLFYALISGIWGFNPTNILWFNSKIGITALIGLFISVAILKES